MAAASSSTPFLEIRQENNQSHQITQHQSSTDASSTAAPPVLVPQKKRRNQPGTPYPDAEVIALSPKTLMATNRFVCEVCNKGFQREQNLQLHRRGHNLPWKLKQKSNNKDQPPPKRKVYLCPEPTCVHHEPSRALGDLTGIKKHFSRKHGEKKWKCDKCSKKYAVQSDWKAHSKTCGTREYRCDCGTLFSRRDSFITHRAFCDALAQESGRNPSNLNNPLGSTHNLYGTNHMMNLGLSQLQHHNNNQQAAATNSTMMLSLGSSAPPKYENLMHNHSSFGVQQQQESPQQQSLMSSSPFFNMTTTDPNQQGFQGGPLFSSNKQQLHGLMQLPDHLQGTNNNNNTSAFNLSFFPNSNSSGSNISDQFNNLSEGGNQGTTTLYTNSPVSNNPHHQVGCSDFSSLFANNSSSVQQQESMSSPHMSATALLQKASQMGSTTTTTSGGCSILRGMGDHNSSSSNGEGMRSSMENEHHHRNLRGFMMNSLANGINTNSMFGNNVFKGNHQFQSVEEPKYKKLSSQNLGVCFGGSDNKLTLDFLGVNGGMVRNSASGHGFSQREQQLQNMGTMNSSMDRKLEPTQPNQPFGSSTLQ